MIHKGDAAWIDNDEISAPFCCSNDLIANNGVRFSCIGSGNEHTVCIADFRDGVGHCATAEGLHEACYGAAVSKPGTVIDIIGSDHRAHEFLKEIVFFVGAAGRGQPNNGIRSMLFDRIR